MKNNNKADNKNKGIISYLPMIIIGVILLVFIIIIAVNLIRWNKGVEIENDPTINVDYESEDNINFLPPSMVKENDDGQNTFLIIGNEALTYNADGESLGEMLSKELKGEVTCVSFPGTTLTSEYSHGPEIENGEDPLDYFTFYWLTVYIHFNDYSKLYEIIDNMEDASLQKTYKENLDILTSYDYENLDFLMVCYDAKDYLLGRDGRTDENAYEITNLYGSLFGSFGNLKDDYPNLQWIVCSPTFCYVIDNSGNKQPCDLTIVSKETLPNMLSNVLNFTIDSDMSYIDNYFGAGINTDNADSYLESDGLSLNKKGRRKVCDHIIDIINKRLG